MGGVVSVLETRSGLEGGCDVAEKGEAVGDTGSSGEAGGVEGGDFKKVGDDGRSSEEGKELAGVGLDEGNKEAGTNCERIEPDDSVGGKLRDGCFDGLNGLFVDGGSHEMSKSREM